MFNFKTHENVLLDSWIKCYYDVDVYITGDIKFHKALEVEGFAVIDIGHFESELPILPLMQGLIAKTKVEVIIAHEEKPWVML